MSPTRTLAASNSFSRPGQQPTALAIASHLNKLLPNGNNSAPGMPVSGVGGPRRK